MSHLMNGGDKLNNIILALSSFIRSTLMDSTLELFARLDSCITLPFIGNSSMFDCEFDHLKEYYEKDKMSITIRKIGDKYRYRYGRFEYLHETRMNKANKLSDWRVL